MKALDPRPSWSPRGPILGATYTDAMPGDTRWETRIMAKAKALWEGLHNGPAGTYIRPHGTSYTFGRWSRSLIPTLGYRFTSMGERPTVEACREALRLNDLELDRRARMLNKRKCNGRN